MHQRTALQSGKHRRVELLREFLVVGQNEAGARAAQRLVRGRGDDMGVGERARMYPARNKTREMRHVDEELGADLVRNGAKAAKIEKTGVGRPPGDNDLW